MSSVCAASVCAIEGVHRATKANAARPLVTEGVFILIPEVEKLLCMRMRCAGRLIFCDGFVSAMLGQRHCGPAYQGDSWVIVHGTRATKKRPTCHAGRQKPLPGRLPRQAANRRVPVFFVSRVHSYLDTQRSEHGSVLSRSRASS